MLLILAGVSLSLVTGSNGILGKAGNAVNESNKATAREEMELVIAELTTDYYWKNVDGTLFDYLVKELESTKNYTTASGANVVCDEKGDIKYTKGKAIYTMSLGADGTITVDDEKIDKKIRTAEELKEFAEEVNAGNSFEGKTVALMNDIDVSSVCGPVTGLGDWTPIGTSTNPFKGTFDGQEYIIENLFLCPSSEESAHGLFGYNEGYIKNCSVSLMIYGGYCSGIAGVNSGTIELCNSNGTTYSNSNYKINMGGISYKNIGTIKSCYNNVYFDNSSAVGGIAYTNSGIIELCWNNKGMQYEDIGGIACYNSGMIRLCYNSGAVGNGRDAGGIAYNNSGTIELCYNTGLVSAYEYCGGIACENSGTINSCYNASGASAFSGAGGIVYWNKANAIIENCYVIGGVSAYRDSMGEIASGGIAVSASNSTIKNCFYLTGKSEGGIGNTDVPGQAEAKTEAELKALASTLGDAFKDDTNNINKGYPILNWQ